MASDFDARARDASSSISLRCQEFQHLITDREAKEDG